MFKNTGVILVSLLLTLNMFYRLFYCFYCSLWTCNCRLGINSSTFGSNIVVKTAWKVSKCKVFSGPRFPILWLNMEIWKVNLRVQIDDGKVGTRIMSVFEHFLTQWVTFLNSMPANGNMLTRQKLIFHINCRNLLVKIQQWKR